MTQQSDRHLTTEQLSALLDEQLSGEERAVCEAHLRDCRQCRSELADFRQTVALLHALPTPELPRSFTLPGNLTYLRERSKPSSETPVLTPTTLARQRRPTPLKRPLRILSTLVAVIGLFFLVSSVITLMSHSTPGSGTSSSTNSGAPASAPELTKTHKTPAGPQKTSVAENPHTASATPGSPSPAPSASPIPTPMPTASENEHTPPGAKSPSLPPPSLPLPNLGTPLGLQEVGFALLILGILGLIFTRRRRAG